MRYKFTSALFASMLGAGAFLIPAEASATPIGAAPAAAAEGQTARDGLYQEVRRKRGYQRHRHWRRERHGWRSHRWERRHWSRHHRYRYRHRRYYDSCYDYDPFFCGYGYGYGPGIFFRFH